MHMFRFFRLTGLVSFVLLLLSACGGDDGSPVSDEAADALAAQNLAGSPMPSPTAESALPGLTVVASYGRAYDYPYARGHGSS